MSQPKSATAASTAISDIGELYREIFARSIDGIAVIDTNGVYVEQNAAHEDLTGYNDSDLAGQTPAIHLGPEGFAEIASALKQYGWYRGRLDSRGKSGAIKKIDLAAFPVRDAAGEPVYFVGIKRDITEIERVASERDARLRELECLYGLTRALNRAHALEEIYDSAIEALLTAVAADRASILTFETEDKMHFRAWRGLSDEYRRAVDGHSPWQRSEQNATSIEVTDVFADATWAAYRPIFEKEGIRSLAFVPITFEGKLLGKFMVYYNQVHEYTSEEIRMAEAVATQIAVVVQRRQSEEALRRSEKLATAGKLAATVAHEINNPLEAVMNLAYLVRRQVTGNPTATQYLDELENELKRVALIARRTLAFYRDTEPPGRIPLRPLIEDIVQLFRPKLETSSIELQCAIDGDPLIYGSTGEIRQVVLNLLANAMEAVGSRGAIEVRVREEGESVIITVGDTGPGIDPANAHMIFEPFFTTKKETGTGLGLPLSREIVQRHRGTLEAANRAGGGALMTITLPAVQDAVEPAKKSA